MILLNFIKVTWNELPEVPDIVAQIKRELFVSLVIFLLGLISMLLGHLLNILVITLGILHNQAYFLPSCLVYLFELYDMRMAEKAM